MSPDIPNTAVFEKEYPCDFSKKQISASKCAFVWGREARNTQYVFIGDLNAHDCDWTLMNTTSQALINHSM